jgi:hypothetical protein
MAERAPVEDDQAISVPERIGELSLQISHALDSQDEALLDRVLTEFEDFLLTHPDSLDHMIPVS